MENSKYTEWMKTDIDIDRLRYERRDEVASFSMIFGYDKWYEMLYNSNVDGYVKNTKSSLHCWFCGKKLEFTTKFVRGSNGVVYADVTFSTGVEDPEGHKYCSYSCQMMYSGID